MPNNGVKPAYMRVSAVNIDGDGTDRLMVVLRTRGCEYAKRNKGGCTVCGFINHADANITDENIVNQLKYALHATELARVGEIDLLTLGSLFNDQEISPETRRELLACLAHLNGVKRVSFESRAEYVTLEKLNECKGILGDKTLELGIGLESADDHVRNNIIKKGLSKERFERLAHLLHDAGMTMLVYLLIKSPHLTERAAIDDALKSMDYVFSLADRVGIQARVALEPVFITDNTYLERLFLAEQYKIVNLWSVVEILIRSRGMGNIFVGMSDEDLSNQRTARSCQHCSADLLEAIEQFNRTQTIDALLDLDCSCKAGYLKDMENGLI